MSVVRVPEDDGGWGPRLQSSLRPPRPGQGAAWPPPNRAGLGLIRKPKGVCRAVRKGALPAEDEGWETRHSRAGTP